MILAAITDNVYRVMFFLHIVAIVAAFAPMILSPVLMAQAKGDGDASFQQTAGYMAANGRRIHFPALILVGLFGIGMIFSSDDVWGFDQTWVSLAFLVWIVLCGVVSGMLLPNERKLAAGDLEVESKVTLGGQIATVLFLVMMYLMIWKPGL